VLAHQGHQQHTGLTQYSLQQTVLTVAASVAAAVVLATVDDDYNLFKEKLIARIPKTSTLLGNIPLAHDG
jgi:hypothetical protein